MKKIVIYARVSTERQEEQKTIQSQLAELREICKDFQIVEEYIDNGWSGETLDRPALDKLRNNAKDGLFEAVCIHSIDRLSRSLYHQGILVEEFKKRGIGIFIKDKPIEDTPEAELLFNMLGAVAQYEKAKILERTKRGRLYKARRGIVVGTRGPFGYDYIKKIKEREGYYEVNPEKADTVKLIFNLYLELGSICGVAKTLTKKGIKPPQGIAWRQSSLKRILTDESYIGTTYFNKTQAIEGNRNSKKYRKLVNSRRRKRDKSEWIPITIPSILNKDTFTAVQKLIKKNHRANNQKYPYLLSGGLVRCIECGSTYCGAMCHGYPSYRCTNRSSRFPLPQNCKSPQITGKKLENAVWDSIYKTIMNPQILINHIKGLNKKFIKGKEDLEKDKQNYLRERHNLDKGKDRLLDIFTEGSISKNDYLKKVGELSIRREELNIKISRIEARLNQAIDRPLFIQDIKYFCSLAKERLDSFTFQDKQKFLRYLVDKIILDSKNRKVKIIGCIPVGNNKIMQLPSFKSAAEFSIPMSNVFSCTNCLKFEIQVRV